MAQFAMERPHLLEHRLAVSVVHRILAFTLSAEYALRAAARRDLGPSGIYPRGYLLTRVSPHRSRTRQGESGNDSVLHADDELTFQREVLESRSQ